MLYGLVYAIVAIMILCFLVAVVIAISSLLVYLIIPVLVMLFFVGVAKALGF